MTRNVQLRFILLMGLLALAVALPAARPLAAATDAFGLTVQVEPAGKGSVNVNPAPPYSENQVVTLTATPTTGWLFDKWVLASDLVWWDENWDYRVAVEAAAAGFARKDKPAEIDINFTQLWTAMGKSGTLDPNSIRVVEVNGSDAVIDAAVPFQFDKAADFNATNKARGTLVLIMTGNTAAGAQRRYHVYFDVTGKGFAAPTVPAQVVLTENLVDEGAAAHKVVTPNGTWWYHPKGGGFSSLNDSDGLDWISYNKTVSGAGGTFRGIPNSVEPTNGGDFHPGHKGMTSTTLNKGPLKVTFHVIESNAPGGRDKWEGMFEIYPGYAVFTMLRAPYDFWVLYEGTPGGQLQTNSDFVVRSNGTQTLASVAWEGDLAPEEWAYVSDPAAGRSLFATNGLDDDKIDSYLSLNGVMTQLGLGRKAAAPQLPLAQVPREFTFGLMDETVYDNAKPIIYNAYKPLNVSLGAAEQRAGSELGSNNPVNFTITGQHTITAHFKPAKFTVNVSASPADKGTVSKTPDQNQYNYDEEVTLVAVPVAGWVFAGWSGDVTGTTNPVTVNVTQNMNVVATFAQSFTVTTSANPVQGGSVTVSPAKPSYEPGEQIQVTAVANSGYGFANWSGDLSGSNPIETVIVNGNLNIVANFSAAQYTFNATANGNGSVDWVPNKALYGDGEIVTVTATPAAGHYLVGWTGDVAPTSVNPLEVTINGNTSVTANFLPITYYTLTTSAVGGGAVTRDPELTQYPAGTQVTLTAVPDAQKRFAGWSGSATGMTNPLTITVNGNMTVVATFEDDVYPLTTTVVGQGSIAKLPDQPAGYFIGQVVTLTATAAPGWTFTGWSGDASGTNPTTSVTIDGPTSVTATFTTLGPFTLTVGATGDGTVDIDPEKTTYAWGETVTLTAAPGAGSVFAGWSGDEVSSNNPLTVIVTGNKHVVAKFIVPSGPFSDNFNSCNLDDMWGQPVNPSGLATFTATGTHLELQIPEGPTHNIWNAINNAPRVLQSADNTDFELVARFDSDVTQNSQMQGIIVEGNGLNLIRFNFNYLNDKVYAYAASLTDGTAKKWLELELTGAAAGADYLRVKRVADKWSMFYSLDGVEWVDVGKQLNKNINFPLTVVKAGVFAGSVKTKNAPAAPAFTARVDYFQNVANGPTPEDAPLLDITIIGPASAGSSPPGAGTRAGRRIRCRCWSIAPAPSPRPLPAPECATFCCRPSSNN